MERRRHPRPRGSSRPALQAAARIVQGSAMSHRSIPPPRQRDPRPQAAPNQSDPAHAIFFFRPASLDSETLARVLELAGMGGRANPMATAADQALLDLLCVISYKWLSRNFSVSSNDAKRLLQEFVNEHGTDIQVIYSVSEWLKNSPENYCVKLTSGPKLEA